MFDSPTDLVGIIPLLSFLPTETMGVKDLWKVALGKFRDMPPSKLQFLHGKRVAVDVSKFVHQLDQIHEVAYARTATPIYPALPMKLSLKAKYRSLRVLDFTCVFVFDGKSPDTKKVENEKRRKALSEARESYMALLGDIKVRPRGSSGEVYVSESEYQEVMKNQRDMARPTIQDYAVICKWMHTKNIEYVQAPFEADAQMQQLLKEGRVDGIITDNGDVIVYGCSHVYSMITIDTNNPEKSECQHFDRKKLRNEEYDSLLASRQRLDFLPEVSCLLGNDYIGRLHKNGPQTVLSGVRGAPALINSLIEHVQSEKPLQEWLLAVEQGNSKNNLPHGDWTDKFIKTCNLLRHYPIF